jgi:GC-rich sequence DNA-binding factor
MDQDSPSTLATKLKNKARKSKPRSRLSFGGDDDEVCVLGATKSHLLIWVEKGSGSEVFQVKKSGLSRKLALGKHPA